MRRVIAVAVVVGLGMSAVATLPAWAGGQTAGAVAGQPVAAPTKVVRYRGLEFRVPAGWPVYRLDLHPSVCVRYDIHAVYLGTPGPDQQCPAHLVGRTQTVSIIPSGGSEGQIAVQRAQPGTTAGTVVGNLPSVHAAVVQDTQRHSLRVTVPAGVAPAATVVATYGASPSAVEQVLASLRAAPGGLDAAPVARQDAIRPQPAPEPTTISWQGVPPGWPVQDVVQPPPPPPPPPAFKPAAGFDTCTAPPLATMRAWRRAFRAVGIYIGGVNAACDPGNLSASWISQAARIGWEMLPLYVGPQSACWGGGGVLINPRHAAAEGAASAADAARDAAFFGLRKGSPVYYDMEAYNQRNRTCVAAVLAFVGAWSRTLTARGYVPAVYSSQDSGIADMEAAAVAKTRGFTAPKAIWFALWDGRATLLDGKLVWPLDERDKQYLGPHNKTVGGITLNIDSDLAGGPVAH